MNLSVGIVLLDDLNHYPHLMAALVKVCNGLSLKYVKGKLKFMFLLQQ